MLEDQLKAQLSEIFSELSSSYTLVIKSSESHPKYTELVEMLQDLAACSTNIECRVEGGTSLEFSLFKEGKDTGIKFRAVPGGHEFSSLVLAILNADNKGKNLPDEFTSARIGALTGEINLTTYMSLSCTACPEVVQALNIMALSSDRITHQAIDGALFEEEAKLLNIQGVPTVFVNGTLLHVGRGSLGELLDKLEAKFGSERATEAQTSEYDLLVAGGGPAGVSAAIYSARKGLKVAIVASRMGGQVNETSTIENIPSIVETSGTKLASELRAHALHNEIEMLENRTIESFEIDGDRKILKLKGGEELRAAQIIIATGATWRRLNIEGEGEYLGRGVAFCPHCDGPLFKGKRVAVIGGGNSGVEAAIDLAGISSHVTLVEFLDTLKADEVLQERLRALDNVTVYTSSATTAIEGDGTKVTALRKLNRTTGEEQRVEIDGIFIQIGLSANSSLFEAYLETNPMGEIIVDNYCRTSLVGVYAAGDVTNTPYKQIVVAMGEAAKAALAAFDDRIRGV